MFIIQYYSICIIFLVIENDSDFDEVFEDISPALPKDLKHIPLNFSKIPTEESLRKSEEFYQLMNKRRTVRHFSKEDIPKEIIDNIIKTAGKLYFISVIFL